MGKVSLISPHLELGDLFREVIVSGSNGVEYDHAIVPYSLLVKTDVLLLHIRLLHSLPLEKTLQYYCHTPLRWYQNLNHFMIYIGEMTNVCVITYNRNDNFGFVNKTWQVSEFFCKMHPV